MKNLLLSVCLLLMACSIVDARPAVLDLNTLDVEFQCLRIVNCEGISEDVCYKVTLQYTDPDFIIKDFREVGVFPKENDDQSVDCQTLEIDIPYIAIGPEGYHVKLQYHLENGKISIKGLEKTNNPTPSTGDETDNNVAGSCYFLHERADIQDICQTYYGEDEELLKINCPPIQGTWVSHEKCKQEDMIGICKDIMETTPHDTVYYDHGILAVMSQQGASSLWIQSIEDNCHKIGGTWIAAE